VTKLGNLKTLDLSENEILKVPGDVKIMPYFYVLTSV